MKLVNIRLRNFRCYQEEISISVDDLTLFIGRNDIGKSTILDALNIFFDQEKIESDDASIRGDKTDVRIICEFEEFPEIIVIDSNYPTTLKKEYLLNEEGRLEIHKVYNCDFKTPKLIATYAKAIHPTQPQHHDLLSLNITQLRDRAKALSLDTSSIDNRSNANLRQLIWQSTKDLKLASKEIHLDEGTAKSIWDQLKTYLPSFALFKSDRPSTDQDSDAQDPMKTAIKEALDSKINELEKIAEYVQEEVRSIAEHTVKKLHEMDPTLAQQLKPNFSPPKWESVFKFSLTDDEDIPMNKRGSGVRRLILLNFFRAKAEKIASEKHSQSLIYAIEEPETSQHPNSQKLLLNALQDISEQYDKQVILTTHTPTLARLVPVDSLRYIHAEDNGNPQILYGYETGTYESITKALGIMADHDVKIFFGVEGQNDIHFFKKISRMLVSNGLDVIDLDELESKGELIFIPVGGSNLALWVSRLTNLNRPEFYIFDRDTKPPSSPKSQAMINDFNDREKCCALSTSKREIENYLHPDAIKLVKPNVDIQFDDYDDVPKLVAKEIHNADNNSNNWDTLSEEKIRKKVSKVKYWLNRDAVANMTLEMLNQRDPNGEVIGWLKQLAKLMETG
ncbi:MAG: ATP-binding protein [Anaerolineae bacterium]|nr:ATP-binding protein [Anaerolineae bacterium]